jgi:hypothetical protein
MQLLRRTLLVLAATALPLLLFATAFDFGVYNIVGKPQPVKKILSDSGIYGSVVSQALNQSKTTSDSTTQPEFNVDLSAAKNNFADRVGQAAKTRAQTLPVCTSVPASTDPLSATCLPMGVTPAQVGDQAKNAVLNGQGFLEHPAITADSFKGANNQSIFDKPKVKQAPKRYQLATKVPFILAALSLLSMLAVVFLSDSRRKGIRRVAIILIIVGIALLLFAWAFNRVMTHNVIPESIPKVALDNKVLQSNVQILATEVTQNIHHNYLVFGIGYLALGIAALLVSMFLRKGGIQRAPAAPEKRAATSGPSAKPARKPAPPPKSPPKIQG